MLKIENITKKFGGITALDECSFEVEEGKVTALVGLNGSGKTTLFNIISGILRPDSGELIFLNRRLSNLSVEKIANLGISRVFQQSKLFDNLTVRENLLLSLSITDTCFWPNLFGLTKDTSVQELRLEEMLKLVDMQNLEYSIAQKISFGQKRVVELLRALLKPHTLLILDEPVAGINPLLKEKIAKILISLKEQETILLIEHDMDFVFQIADQIVVLDKGKVIAKGDSEAIKADQKVNQIYLGGFGTA
jgi:branched-chain amino acid transport system ATP-binding protein